MQIGMIGLGRMGANMARRLTQDGHQYPTSDFCSGFPLPNR
jgi:3-hydroxyisobutyrate dehydrogenase-like beta-hydroxyacid dehydrogenase